jgi:hypothetical protein
MIVVFVFVLVAGCGSTAVTSPPTGPPTSSSSTTNATTWPEKLDDFRFRWSAEPGFELTTGQAVPLRAYLESWLVILYTADPDAGYPGFESATPEPVDRTSPAWLETPYAHREIRGYSGKSDFDTSNQRIVGNEDLHVLRVDPMPSGFRAFVCDAAFGVYEQRNAAPTFTPLNYKASSNSGQPDFHNMKVWRIEFSDNETKVGSPPPAAPTVPQVGPLPAPLIDVFGPWSVTGATNVAFWSDIDFSEVPPGSPESKQRFHEAQAAEDAMRQQCLAQYPLNAEQRKAIATTVIDKPPAVKPALPGWPE